MVDHDERRRAIADAMWQVIARDGLEAASARTVAAEGGWSLGAVRHYFRNHDELLRFAIDRMLEGVTQRIREEWRGGQPGQARCRRVLEQLLPLDERRIGEVRVWLAALVRAQVDPLLDDLRHAGWRGTRLVCRGVVTEVGGQAELFAALMEGGERALPACLERHAAHLHTWIDGLTLQAVTMPEVLGSRQVRTQLADQLGVITRAVTMERVTGIEPA